MPQNHASLKTVPRTVFRTLLTGRKRPGLPGANQLAITVFDSYDDIVEVCCNAWNFLANDPKAIASITTRAWAQVS